MLKNILERGRHSSSLEVERKSKALRSIGIMFRLKTMSMDITNQVLPGPRNQGNRVENRRFAIMQPPDCKQSILAMRLN